MRKICCFALLLLVFGGAIRADIPVGQDAKRWHIYANTKAISVVAVDGNMLRITFRNTDKYTLPDARLSFAGALDVSKTPVFSFRFKVSVPGRNGVVAIRFPNGDVISTLPTIAGLGWNGNIPAGQWLEAKIDLRNRKLPKGVVPDLAKVIQIGIGYQVRSIPENESVTIEISDMAFKTVEESSAEADKLEAEWNNRIAGGKAATAPLPPPAQTLEIFEFYLVKESKPIGEIVVGDNPSPLLTMAAKELQRWIKAISGGMLPIVGKADNQGRPRIFLGGNSAVNYGSDLKKIGTTDGYAVRRKGTDIYIFGSTDKGTLNGVFAFLEKNSDLIFPRPNLQFEAIFTSSSNFPVQWANGLSVPKSRTRGWIILGHAWTNDELWNLRNFCNNPDGGGGWNPAVKFRHKWGSMVTYGGGHNLFYLLANTMSPSGKISLKELFARHPDYFALINGKRQFPKGMENNPCFSSPGMRRTLIENIVRALHDPALTPVHADALSVKIEDNWGLCQCPLCMAPIELPDGRKVVFGDDNFRSTQTFMFLNEVAAAVSQVSPGTVLNCYGYFFTAEPPAINVHPAIRVFFCPYIRPNDKKPLYAKENRLWWNRMKKYAAVCDRLLIREYFGCGMNFPRPLADVAAYDFREYIRHGVKEFNSEISVDRNWRGNDGKKHDPEAMWDVSAMEFWVITRLFWDPDQEVETLRHYYATRVWRSAAVPMLKFYAALREAYYRSPLSSTCGDAPLNLTSEYIVRTNNEANLRNCLIEAEKLADHPLSRQLIRRTRARFEGWLASVRDNKTPQAAAPLLRGESPVKRDSSRWNSATVLEPFRLHGDRRTASCHATEVKIFHDAESLHLKIRCNDPAPEKLHTLNEKSGELPRFPNGDQIEVFCSDQSEPARFFQFAVDCKGGYIALDGSSGQKLPNKWSADVLKDGKGYEVLMSIPFELIKFNLGKGKELKMLIFRQVSHNHAAEREMSSWGGGRVRQPAEFGTMTLMR